MSELAIRDEQRVPTGFVYLIGDYIGHVKVGWTTNFRTRLATLQTGNPAPLQVLALYPATRELERLLHKAAAEWRLTGEWFYHEDGFWPAIEPLLTDFVDVSRTGWAPAE